MLAFECRAPFNLVLDAVLNELYESVPIIIDHVDSIEVEFVIYIHRGGFIWLDI